VSYYELWIIFVGLSTDLRFPSLDHRGKLFFMSFSVSGYPMETEEAVAEEEAIN
jgi:hypothetical protein